MKFKGNRLYLSNKTFIELKIVHSNIAEGIFDSSVDIETLIKIDNTIIQNKFENILADIVKKNGVENEDGSITWMFSED